jgi:hypothetical protein
VKKEEDGNQVINPLKIAKNQKPQHRLYGMRTGEEFGKPYPDAVLNFV